MTARQVSAAFLDALPQGPDLALPALPGLGGVGPMLSGTPTRVGQVFTVDVPGGPAHYAVATLSGFTRITATGAALLTGDPDVRRLAYAGGSSEVREISEGAVQSAETPDAGLLADPALPAAPPGVVGVPAGSDACVQVGPGRGNAGVTVSVALVPEQADSDSDQTPQTPAMATVPACLPVDEIRIRPGSGALIRVLGAAGTDLGGTVYLVTDLGVKYLVPTAAALADLGYTAADERGLPTALLTMLPTGPDLDPQAAADGTGNSSPAPC